MTIKALISTVYPEMKMVCNLELDVRSKFDLKL